jgi:hypothetical protein
MAEIEENSLIKELIGRELLVSEEELAYLDLKKELGFLGALIDTTKKYGMPELKKILRKRRSELLLKLKTE